MGRGGKTKQIHRELAYLIDPGRAFSEQRGVSLSASCAVLCEANLGGNCRESHEL